MRFIAMFITAVCVLFLIKLRWPRKKSIYALGILQNVSHDGYSLFFFVFSFEVDRWRYIFSWSKFLDPSAG